MNSLTIKLAASDQQPKSWPPRRVAAEAVEGGYVAEVTLDPAGAAAGGHLTSPVIPIRGGQVYTLSAYVKSEVSAASLRLCFWTRPLDWRELDLPLSSQHYLSYQGPDAQSGSMSVSRSWQRYQFTFVVEHLVSRGVVDLVVTGNGPRKAWVDAVQLEPGPRASSFLTRYPVEASLAGRRRPPMLHLVDEPLELHLATYNSGGSARRQGMELSVETLKGFGVLTQCLKTAVQPGYHELKLRYPFERVGEFRARLTSDQGDPIGLEDYLFVVHPRDGEESSGCGLFSQGPTQLAGRGASVDPVE